VSARSTREKDAMKLKMAGLALAISLVAVPALADDTIKTVLSPFRRSRMIR
jgi:hypothetical protein